ncbi:hypothetical protein Hypma_013004 [Hypsizygus marmoreus]|uniref:Protein kinase domain-containing protein n=1 Tax=Hypsizygus marmoreus TaxID=39966 RepID=A0A369JK16_HYPMA|nr:hypothetical protein Hypma_013004 [Hypsizygus marmoreus]
MTDAAWLKSVNSKREHEGRFDLLWNNGPACDSSIAQSQQPTTHMSHSRSSSSSMTSSSSHSQPERFDYSSGRWSPKERFWVAHQPFLLSRGYRLRPRYDPNWIPSWEQSGDPIDKTHCEDSIYNVKCILMDATRISDNCQAVIKLVEPWTDEIPVARYLSSQTASSDPRNHSVPVLDVILSPSDDDLAFLVMPLLLDFERFPFRRVGEVTEAFQQFLEGLEFMHEHNIAHRDACYFNLMLDASNIVPNGFHFIRRATEDGVKPIKELERWSVRPVKYYFIDFELSTKYPAGATHVMDVGFLGQDKSVPEMSLTVPYNPFKVDVYQLGNVFLGIVDKYDDLEQFRPLCLAMTEQDPALRPSAAAALQQFEAVVRSLTTADLERRIWFRHLDPIWRF